MGECAVLSVDFCSTVKKNVILTLFAMFILACSLLLMAGSSYHIADAPDSLLNNDNSAESNEQRIAFLSALNITVDTENVEMCEIQIPMEFNDVYTNYNELQKEIGSDLSLYRGALCTRYTYMVDESIGLAVNIIVYQGKIIGGDICTTALSGEMYPLNYYL